jgi:hypothetical protein
MNILPHDTIVYDLSSMLNDDDIFRLFTTNKYIYNTLAPKVKLRSQYNLEEVIGIKFILTNIRISVCHILHKYFPAAKLHLLKLNGETFDDYIHRIDNSVDKLINQIVHKTSPIEILELSPAFKIDVNYLPLNLKRLTILGFCDKSTYILPSNIHTLIINWQDKCKLDIDNLPPNIHTLELTGNFNLPVDHLPSNLHTLILGRKFNHPIDHLPSNLHTLIMKGQRFNYPINNLPANLHTFQLGCKIHASDFGENEFWNFQHDFNCSVDHLPSNLHVLDLSGGYQNIFNQKINNFPSKLHTLRLGICFNYPLDNLPRTLEILEFDDIGHFNQPLHKLPSTLRKLKLGFSFNNIISNIPTSVLDIEFEITARFNQIIKLPINIRSLKLGSEYDKLITHYPNSLKKLCIGKTQYKFH